MIDQSKNKYLDSALLVAASLTIAFVIWYMAQQENVSRRYITVDIQATGAPEHIEVQFTPRKALVQTHYRQVNESRVEPGSFYVPLDLSGVEEWAGVGEYAPKDFPLLELQERQKNALPALIDHSIASPEQARVEARWRVTEARIEPLMDVKLEDFYEVRETSLQPALVLLTGSRRDLERLPRSVGKATVQTESIEVYRRKSEMTGMIGLALPPGIQVFDPESRTTVEEFTVEYRIQIEPREDETRLTDVPVRISTLSKQVSIEWTKPTTVEVTISGPVKLLGRVQPEFIKFKLPLDESVDFEGQASIEGIWAESTPAEIRETSRIVKILPETITLKQTVTPVTPQP